MKIYLVLDTSEAVAIPHEAVLLAHTDKRTVLDWLEKTYKPENTAIVEVWENGVLVGWKQYPGFKKEVEEDAFNNAG